MDQEIVNDNEGTAWPALSADLNVARATARTITLDTHRASENGRILEVSSQLDLMRTRLSALEHHVFNEAGSARNNLPDDILDRIAGFDRDLTDTSSEFQSLAARVAAAEDHISTTMLTSVEGFDSRMDIVEQARRSQTNELNELTGYLEQAFTRISELAGLIEDERGTNSAARAENFNQVNQLGSEIDDKVNHLDAAISALSSRVDLASNSIDASASSATAALEASISSLESRMDNAEARLGESNEVATSIQFLTARAEALEEAQINTSGHIIESVESAHARIDEVASTKSDIDALGTDIEQIKDVVDSQAELTATNVDKIESLSDSLTSIGNIASGQETVLETHSHILDTTTSLLTQHSGLLTESQESIAEYNEQLDSHAATVARALDLAQQANQAAHDAASRVDVAVAGSSDDVRNQVDVAARQLDTVGQTVDQLTDQVADASLTIEQAHARIDEAHTVVADAAALLETYRAETDVRITDTNHEIHTRIDTVLGKIDELEEASSDKPESELVSKLELVQSQLEETTVRLDELRGQVDSKDNRIGEAHERITASEARIGEAHDRINGAETRLDKVDEQINSTAEESQNTTERVDEVNARVSETNELVEIVDGRVTQTDNRIDSVDDRVTSFDDKITTIDGQVAETTDRIGRVNARVSETNELVEIVDGRVTQTDNRINTIDDQVGDFDERVESLEQQVDSLESSVIETLAAANQASEREAEESLTSLSDQLADVRDSTSASTLRIDAVHDQLNDLNQSTGELRENLAALSEQVGEQDHADVSPQMLEAINARLDAADSQLSAITENVDTFSAQVESVDSRIEESDERRREERESFRQSMFTRIEDTEGRLLERISTIESTVAEASTLESNTTATQTPAIDDERLEVLTSSVAQAEESAREAQSLSENLRVLQTDLVQTIQSELQSQAAEIEQNAAQLSELQTAASGDTDFASSERVLVLESKINESLQTISQLTQLQRRNTAVEAQLTDALTATSEGVEHTQQHVIALRSELDTALARIARLEAAFTQPSTQAVATQPAVEPAAAAPAQAALPTDPTRPEEIEADTGWFTESYERKNAG